MNKISPNGIFPNVISRRGMMKGLAAGVPLAAVLADPLLARAAAEKLETVTIATSDGRRVSGALAMPERTPAASVLLVHEWWGLNDQIRAVAADFAKQGYMALALDMYGGQLAGAGERDAARALMKAVKPEEGVATVAAWAAWLKEHVKGTGRLGTVGWCFGGGWSLNTAVHAPVDACVVYYGRVNKKAAELASLKGPVLGHFATRDQWINQQMIDGFEAEMTKAGKPFTTHWYEADHAFANPTGSRYDKDDAKLSWKRTTAFFRKHLA